MEKQKRPYQPPNIERLQNNVMGKHQVFDLSPTQLFDEPYDLEALIAEYGSPLFLASETTLRAQFRNFRALFSANGIQTKIAYSYKTNYLPAICALFHQEGAWAEVVSGMEYQLARSLGVPGSEIVFNGPYKCDEELEQAILDGALVNLDGFDELQRISAIAEHIQITARIGIRIHFSKGAHSWDRFGFGFENDEYKDALKQIADSAWLNLEALHNHSGTFQVDPKVYGRATEVLCEVARTARQLGLQPTIIDLGGGYPSNNLLKPDFDLSVEDRASGQMLSRFAEEIFSRLNENRDLFADGSDTQLTLILEPGRALVDATMQLITTVVATKSGKKGKRTVVLDAGVNLLPTAYWYDHDIDPVDAISSGATSSTDSSAENLMDLCGPLCMQIDKIREDVMLPNVQPGTRLTVANVGAYCLTQSMQFIQPRPAVVLLTESGPKLIRRAERREDIFAMDRVPAHLRHENGAEHWVD